ncbi:MAG: redoxin domain-containing protein [Actinobacteria bacterium]|nr:redoxin domain-containing protein [Actinomycetota bacterium]
MSIAKVADQGAGQSGGEAVVFSGNQQLLYLARRTFMARTKTASVPEVGGEAPEFHLPSAQGGQLRLSMRTARGPVVVVFYSGVWSEEDVAYFKDLAAKEDEINMAAASVVGIGRGEPDAARGFARETGIKSYVLYDYAGIATREYGLLEKDKEHGEYARPATFIVGSEHEVVHAWVGERPTADEILAKVSGITGLPKPAEEEDEASEEKPKKRKAAGKTVEETAARGGEATSKGETVKAEERKKLSPEEREKRRAERRSTREEGAKGVAQPENEAKGGAETEARPAEGRGGGEEPGGEPAKEE